MNDLDDIYAATRAALRAENISPSDRTAVEAVAERVVADYMIRAGYGPGLAIPLADPSRTVAEIVADVCDYGVLGELFGTPGIEDISIEGDQVSYFTEGRWRFRPEPTREGRNLHVVRRLLDDAGVALDDAHPWVDGVQVLDGRGRLGVAIHPATSHLSVTLRLKGEKRASLDDLVEADMLSTPAADLLGLVLLARGGFVIAGEAGSGKTTLLTAVLEQSDPTQMIRIVEESTEIDFTPLLGGSYQVVPGPDDGLPCRSLAGLVRGMLRFRPDLIVVGEVRGKEAWDLARAAGVGAGFATTIHAPNALRALESLALLCRGHADRPEPVVIRETFSHLLHFVVYCERGLAPDGNYVHQVTEIRAVVPPMDAGRAFSTEAIFERPDGIGTPMVWTKISPPTEVVDRLERAMGGRNLRALLAGET